jgi:antirestriction protein ArdC
MICSELGIEDCDFTNGAAYIADWLGKLRDDKLEVFRAAADAQRIADFLLAFHPAYAECGRSSEKPSSRVNPVNSGWSHRLLRCIVQ